MSRNYNNNRNFNDRPKRQKPQRRIRQVPPPPKEAELVFATGERVWHSSVRAAKKALAVLVMHVFPPKKSPDEPKKAWVEK